MKGRRREREGKGEKKGKGRKKGSKEENKKGRGRLGIQVSVNFIQPWFPSHFDIK